MQRLCGLTEEPKTRHDTQGNSIDFHRANTNFIHFRKLKLLSSFLQQRADKHSQKLLRTHYSSFRPQLGVAAVRPRMIQLKLIKHNRNRKNRTKKDPNKSYVLVDREVKFFCVFIPQILNREKVARRRYSSRLKRFRDTERAHRRKKVKLENEFLQPALRISLILYFFLRYIAHVPPPLIFTALTRNRWWLNVL